MLDFRKDYVLRQGNEKVPAYEWVAKNPVFVSRVTDENGQVVASSPESVDDGGGGDRPASDETPRGDEVMAPVDTLTRTV